MLANALETNNTLESLDLGGNSNIGADGLKTIFNAIKTSRSLKKISFNGTCIDANSAEALAEALAAVSMSSDKYSQKNDYKLIGDSWLSDNEGTCEGKNLPAVKDTSPVTEEQASGCVQIESVKVIELQNSLKTSDINVARLPFIKGSSCSPVSLFGSSAIGNKKTRCKRKKDDDNSSSEELPETKYVKRQQ